MVALIAQVNLRLNMNATTCPWRDTPQSQSVGVHHLRRRPSPVPSHPTLRSVSPHTISPIRRMWRNALPWMATAQPRWRCVSARFVHDALTAARQMLPDRGHLPLISPAKNLARRLSVYGSRNFELRQKRRCSGTLVVMSLQTTTFSLNSRGLMIRINR